MAISPSKRPPQVMKNQKKIRKKIIHAPICLIYQFSLKYIEKPHTEPGKSKEFLGSHVNFKNISPAFQLNGTTQEEL